jgi:colanic acid biosynthesis protein WcaH
MQGEVWLDKDVFETIVAATPLISIDLIVRDSLGRVLLGKRVNSPAEGYWFVPGGRILKNETLSNAFSRLTQNELGLSLSISKARYIGLFEHFYSDSIFGQDVDTHYIVQGFEIVVESDLPLPPLQHSDYRWLLEADLLESDDVHNHSKWYFQQDKGFRI